MFQEKIDLLGAVRFSLLPSKCFALFPYAKKCGVYKLSYKAMLLSFLVCLVIFAFSLWKLYTKRSSNEDLFNLTEIFILNVVMSLSLYEISQSIGSLNDCLESLEEVEEGLKAVGQKPLFYRDSRHLFLSLFTGCALVSSRLSKYSLADGAEVWENSLELIVFASVLLQEIALSHRFSGLLGTVSDLLASCKRELFVSSRHTPSVCSERLQHLVELHSKLCLASLKLNSCQEKQVLAIVFSCLVLSIAEAYRTIMGVAADWRSPQVVLFVLNLVGIGVFFNMCNQIVQACKTTSLRAKEFNNLLYELMIDDKSSILSSNKKLRLHFGMKRDIVFTACGFFKLDSTLIHSMVASATTYLVLLLQLDRPANRNATSN